MVDRYCCCFFVLTPIHTAIRSENDDVPLALYMFDSVYIETKDFDEYSELIEKKVIFPHNLTICIPISGKNTKKIQSRG